ncbi:Jip4 protein [Pichia kluyveri]|uniref:Jip4 protein n=1 Tax=Pichia kluyveri TaxID=36015 RepID=A0AAV5R7S7_PICKL|nr:Jip4 protein [Pichia kluyveri]
MSRGISEDYFLMTRTNRDGALSPYSSNMMSPNTPGGGLHPTLSWGETPEFAGLTKTKSHTGNTVFKSVNLGKVQRDTKVYPYHTIHLTTPPPNYLLPVSPEDLLAKITGRCVECSNRMNSKCTHLPSQSSELDSSSLNKHIPLISKNSFSGSLSAPSTANSINKKKSILSKRGNENAHIESHFSNSVSFDTVNLKFSDDLNNYPLSSFSDSGDEADIDNNTDDNLSNKDSQDNDFDDSRGRSKSKSKILNNRHSSKSPSRSLSPRANMILPSDLDMVSQKHNSMRHLFSLKYPTSPIITHDACTITKKHKFFDDMYAGRLRSLSPKLKNRNIMCHVSGRKHTWVGIDWVCNQFLEDGDTIIIVAAIKNPGRSLSRYQRRNSSDVAYVSNITENKIRNSPEYAQTVSENIMKYALSIINPDRIVKITVELAIGSTSDVFNDMFDLYQPSLIIIGTKPGKVPPTKSWATKRLTDRIVVTSPVPTIIISPINMGLYENKLFKVLDKRMKFMNRDNPNTVYENDELLSELDNIGVYSLEDQREYIKKTAVNDKVILNELNSVIKEMKHVEEESGFSSNIDDDDDDDESNDEERSDYEPSIDSFESKSLSSSNESKHLSEDKSKNLQYPKLTIEKSNSDRSDDDISVDSSNPPPLVVNNTNTDITTSNPSFKLKRLELQTQIEIYKAVAKLESETLHEDSFKQLLTVISDSAHKYGVQLAESAKLGGEESQLVRTLTGAPEQLQRTKSMVSDKVEEDDFNEKLKRFRQQKKLKQQQDKINKNNIIAGNSSRKSVPKINIDSPSVNSSVGSSLKKSKSPVISISSGSISGNTGIHGTLSGSDSKSSSSSSKKKKKKFFGLF